MASSDELTSPSPSPSPPPRDASGSKTSKPGTGSGRVDSGSELSDLSEEDDDGKPTVAVSHDSERSSRRVVRRRKGGVVPDEMWAWAYKKKKKRADEDEDEDDEDEPMGDADDDDEDEPVDAADDHETVELAAGDADLDGPKHDIDLDVEPAADISHTSDRPASKSSRASADAADDDAVGLVETAPDDEEADEEEDEEEELIDEEEDEDNNNDDQPAPASIIPAAVAPEPSPSPSTSPSPEPDNDLGQGLSSTIQRSALNRPRGDDHGMDRDSDVDEEDEEEDDEDLFKDSDLQPAHRAEALDDLAAIELKVALLREKLYHDKLCEQEREQAMVTDGSHPEMLHLYSELAKRRDRRLDIAERKRTRQLEFTLAKSKAEEHVTWSWWTNERDELQSEMISQTNRKRRRLEREKRAADHPRPHRSLPQQPSSRSIPRPVSVRAVLRAQFEAPYSHAASTSKSKTAIRTRVLPSLTTLNPNEAMADIEHINRSKGYLYNPQPRMVHPLPPGQHYDAPYEPYVQQNQPPLPQSQPQPSYDYPPPPPQISTSDYQHMEYQPQHGRVMHPPLTSAPMPAGPPPAPPPLQSAKPQQKWEKPPPPLLGRDRSSKGGRPPSSHSHHPMMDPGPPHLSHSGGSGVLLPPLARTSSPLPHLPQPPSTAPQPNGQWKTGLNGWNDPGRNRTKEDEDMRDRERERERRDRVDREREMERERERAMQHLHQQQQHRQHVGHPSPAPLLHHSSSQPPPPSRRELEVINKPSAGGSGPPGYWKDDERQRSSIINAPTPPNERSGSGHGAPPYMHRERDPQLRDRERDVIPHSRRESWEDMTRRASSAASNSSSSRPPQQQPPPPPPPQHPNHLHQSPPRRQVQPSPPNFPGALSVPGSGSSPSRPPPPVLSSGPTSSSSGNGSHPPGAPPSMRIQSQSPVPLKSHRRSISRSPPLKTSGGVGYTATTPTGSSRDREHYGSLYPLPLMVPLQASGPPPSSLLRVGGGQGQTGGMGDGS